MAMRDGDSGTDLVDEDGSPMVETIIMEGSFVRDSIEEDLYVDRKPDDEDGDPASLLDTYILNRSKEPQPRARRSLMIAAVGLLALGLIVQVVHSHREDLATMNFFAGTFGPVYQSMGMPVTPNWDVRDWQFEATSGSTGEDEQLLTITSRISNRSDRALPYPLVHVSLTDRYEEIVGSRVLEPDEYVGRGVNPDLPVPAGANFTATISIAGMPAEATGFKLNVCYRESASDIRCAIEDFK